MNMSTRKKMILTCVIGLVIGIIGGGISGYFVGYYQGRNIGYSNGYNQRGIDDTSKTENKEDKDLKLFDSPQKELKVRSFKVIQVLSDGSALAKCDEFGGDDLDYGTVVRFQATEGTLYYDDQIIKLPQGKHFRLMGTFDYESRREGWKTVPVIGIFDK